MYGLYGANHNIKNVYCLAAPYVENNEIENISQLKSPYLKFLDSIQPEFPHNRSKSPIIEDPKIAKKLMNGFAESKVNDLDQEKMLGEFYADQDFKTRATAVEFNRNKLSSLNGEISALFELVIHSVLLSSSQANRLGRKAFGGTSNKCIGLMWLSLNSDGAALSSQDILEMLIHEMTHTLVFIDELNSPQFNYENLGKNEYWARSSILNRQRPMDKVVHSIMVASEILYARATFLENKDTLSVHPNSNALKANAKASIASVLNHPNLNGVCRPRAITMVEDALVFLNNL